MHSSTLTATTVIDPVCGMTVDPAHAAGSSAQNGQSYSFCSGSCKSKFDKAPDKYVGAGKKTAEAASCCGGAGHTGHKH
jgi:P-type Cu+ transporter